jgi:phage baseplate assembly protein W
MATIDLNNLIRPKQTNSSKTLVTQNVSKPLPVYVDLHLDLQQENSIGVGLNSVKSNDLLVDTDIQAIKNAIKNIFTTRKGEKVLSPEFGCSLEQYLFDPVTQLGAKAIGTTIYDAITQFEPRVTVINVNVKTSPYSTPSSSFANNILAYTNNNRNGQDIGPGYAVTVIYQFKEINTTNTLNIFAELGGQILF